jgi:prefoldin alpha subunit
MTDHAHAEDSKDAQAKAQRKYLELQVLNQKMQQVQQQMEALEQQAEDVDKVTKHLDELSAVHQGTELLVPIANGIFLKASLKDAKNLIVNIGANTAVPKSVPDVKLLIATQLEELRQLQKDLAGQLETLTSHAGKAETELRQLVS